VLGLKSRAPGADNQIVRGEHSGVDTEHRPSAGLDDRGAKAGLGAPDRSAGPSRRVLASVLELAQVVLWELDSPLAEPRWFSSPEVLFGYEPGRGGFRSAASATVYVPLADPAAPGEPLGSVLLAPVLRSIRAGMPWSRYELVEEVVGPDGVRHLAVIRALVDPEQGSWAGIVADVTQGGDSPWLTADIAERHRLLVENSPDGIVVHQDGLLAYANQAVARMVGITRDADQFVGRPIADFLDSHTLREMLRRLERLTTPGSSVTGIEAEIIGFDGRSVPVEVSSIRTTWSGRPAYQVVLRDVSERRRAEASLRYQASLVAAVSDAIIGLDGNGVIRSWNPAAVAIYGFEEAEAVGKAISGLLSAPTGPDGLPDEGIARHRRKDGSVVDVRVKRSTLGGDAGGPTGWVMVVTELTEARAATEARKEIERRYAAAVAALDEGVLVVDHQGVVRASNDSAMRILGARVILGSGDFVFTGHRPARKPEGGSYAPDELPIARALAERTAVTNLVLGVIDDDGHTQWLSVSAQPLPDGEAANGAAVVCSVSDITEHKQLVDRLAWEARHDALTGLANRAGFLAELDAILIRDRWRRDLALFFVDLDRFKLVNDSLGHSAGDEVLLTVAQRIREWSGASGLISRLHGDEFAALEVDVIGRAEALARAEELRSLLSRPITLSTGRTVTVTPSLGVVVLGEGATGDGAEMLKDADMAMLRSKSEGRGRVTVFDVGLREEIGGRLQLEADLRVATSRGELRIDYQPIASLTDGRLIGFEALVRWNHPEKGLLMPDLFIPLAEESELIAEVGTWVLNGACSTIAQWRDLLPAEAAPIISVNVSPRQLKGSKLLHDVEDTLARTGLPPSALILEITETGLVSDDGSVYTLLEAIRALGVSIAIDDFGTGYSSLAHLKRLPVNYLKIDRSFVTGLGEDNEDEHIVAGISELAHGLGIWVTVEGVETEPQRQAAAKLGCDLYQGFLLGRPRDPDEVPLAMLAELGDEARGRNL